MILTLELTNFKKHESLVINFTENLNALRGANEAGKSTIIHGIAYAFFGSRALPLSLEETVTWGKQVSTLKVELTFSQGGKTFKIVRKKSGAELVGDGVVASGQAEVTAFVERLFGASAAIAQATMLVSQKSLQDGLDSSAMPLIEKLANMSLIDELIDKVQKKLPSGNTKTLEAQLATLSGSEEPKLDISSMCFELETLKGKLAAALEIKQSKQDTLKVLEADLKSYSEKLTFNNAVEIERGLLKAEKVRLQQQLAVPEYTKVDVEALLVKAELQQTHKARKDAFEKFSKLPEQTYVDASTLTSDMDNVRNQLSELSKKQATAMRDLAVAKSMLITDSVCGLCSKDLSQVPEVIEKNSKTQELIGKLSAHCAELDCRFAELSSVEGNLRKIVANSANYRRLFPIPFVNLDETTTPPTAVWVGGKVEVLEYVDYTSLISSAKKANEGYDRCLAQAEYAAARLKVVEGTTFEQKHYNPSELYAQLHYPSLKAEVEDQVVEVRSLDGHIRELEHSIATAKAVHESEMASYVKNKQTEGKLITLLGEHNFNNTIIQKLREARPAVAARLWALVLAGVSHYFSQIRGVKSTVTRGEKGFLIDGKSMEAYSGSTQDSLGLAIRLTLQKTFLPNIDFMLVDEPGAAFDDGRESDMLGVLSSAGLEQVLLVTHSDLADTFAASVVQI